jgi:hypothetical protein
MCDELEKDQKEFEGNMSIEMYQELLTKSYEKIANLKLALGATHSLEIDLRDNIAKMVYPTFLLQSTSTEQAAEDAYRAADKMLRVRETGVAYDSEIIQLLKEMRDNTPNDQAFGRTIRTFLKDK